MSIAPRLTIVTALLLVTSVGAADPKSAVPASDPGFRYAGRFDTRDPTAARMQWPLSTVHARFTGTSVAVRLRQEKTKFSGDYGHYYAIVDGAADKPVLIETGDAERYPVADGLPPGEHTLELVRLAGPWKCVSRFEGLELDAGRGLAAPPPAPGRRMEVYGDSITEGSYMAGQPKEQNAYLTYGAVAGRKLAADVRLHAKGGLGLIKGYALPHTLPGIYDRVLPGDPKGPRFDFASWVPHVVVVNIGQNDAWTLKGAKTPREIVDAYKGFLAELRERRPAATIVCCLGSMDATKPGSPWPGYLTTAVEELRKGAGDARLHTLFFRYVGRKGHPTPAEQAAMADQLIAFLRPLGDGIWADAK